MPSVQMDGLDRILNSWDALQREFPVMKRDLREDLGEQMLSGGQRDQRRQWTDIFLYAENRD